MYFYPTCVNTERKKLLKFRLILDYTHCIFTYVLKQKIDKATANLFWGYF